MFHINVNLYKPTTGKWYGTYSFQSENNTPTNSEVISEGRKQYSFPEEFLIHVRCGTNSRIILPTLD